MRGGGYPLLPPMMTALWPASLSLKLGPGAMAWSVCERCSGGLISRQSWDGDGWEGDGECGRLSVDGEQWRGPVT